MAREINLKRLRMIATDLAEEGHYMRGQTVNDAADIIEELLGAAYEGLNQLSMASGYLSRDYKPCHGGTSDYQVYQNAVEEIILPAIRLVHGAENYPD